MGDASISCLNFFSCLSFTFCRIIGLKMPLIDDRSQFFSFSLTSVASDVFKICLATKCFPPGKARHRHFPAARYFSRLPDSFDKAVVAA